MPHTNSPRWEPEPQRMGNWQSMFEPERGGKATGVPSIARGETPREQPPDENGLALDLSVYKPWILQRGRSRGVMMLDLRRFEPRSGLWMGWQLAYAHLVAVEYVGDRMLSLDFGTRQFMIEGHGLDELARHFHQGTVMAVHEYAAAVWPLPAAGGSVAVIRKIDPRRQESGNAD